MSERQGYYRNYSDDQEGEGYTVKMGATERQKVTDGSLIFRVPSFAIELHGYCRGGWFGYDPINQKWVSAAFSSRFEYRQSLNEALKVIKWRHFVTSRQCINWIDAYQHHRSLRALNHEQRMAIAELLFNASPPHLVKVHSL